MQSFRSFFKRQPLGYTGTLLPPIADLRQVKGLEANTEKWINFTATLLQEYKTLSPSNIIELAPSKDLKSLTTLGVVISMGTEKNETQFSIARLILEACKDDSPAAKFELANLALKGCKEAEILPNPIESRRLLLENASEPTLHGPSQFTLGNQLLNDPIAGDSVSEEDTKRGLTFIKQAALSGVPAACAQMGYLYYNQHDFKKAHEYLILAKSDHPEVLFLLGLLHSTSKLFGPVKANEAKSYAYFLRAANLGLACAQHNVGVALMPGAGSIEPELWKAIEYWKMAAEQGFHLSLINLGKIYMQGMECKGFKVERDLVQARGLFERIVEDGKVEGGVDEAYVGQAREFLEILDQMEE